MKTLLRSPFMQSLLTMLSAAYLRAIIRTVRWRFGNRAIADPLMAAPEGFILMAWHGRIVTMAGLFRELGERRLRAMISLSRDGEFITRAAEMVGVPAIRGSVSKGGAVALRQALDALGGGEIVLMFPDGPRGPNQTMAGGPVQLARMAGAQVLLVGLASRPCLRFRSWDEAAIPLPFARCAAVVAGPFHVPKDADAQAVTTAQARWQAALREAQVRAEAMLQERR
jgi:hypothetical protein